MARHNDAALPGPEDVYHRSVPLSIQLVGRLIEKQTIRLREQERCQRLAGALPPGQRLNGRFGADIKQTGTGKRTWQGCFQCPVNAQQMVGSNPTLFGAAQERQPRANPKMLGDVRLSVEFAVLREVADAPASKGRPHPSRNGKGIVRPSRLRCCDLEMHRRPSDLKRLSCFLQETAPELILEH